MRNYIHIARRILFACSFGIYYKASYGGRTVLYVLMMVVLAVFCISQGFFLMQEKRKEKGLLPIEEKATGLFAVLSVGVPVEGVREARSCFLLHILLLVVVAITHYPGVYPF